MFASIESIQNWSPFANIDSAIDHTSTTLFKQRSSRIIWSCLVVTLLQLVAYRMF